MYQSRDLEAQTLPSARRHQYQRILAVQETLYDLSSAKRRGRSTISLFKDAVGACGEPQWLDRV
jgi:hypothetical protein